MGSGTQTKYVYLTDWSTNAATLPPMDTYAGKVNAPEFPEGLAWVNTDRPLRLAELRGKVILRDFWTFC